MATRGRNSKYTPAITKEICDYIRSGSTQHDAASLAGISTATFYDWYNRHPDFSDAIQKAHAEFKQKNIAAIRAAGIRMKPDQSLEGSWQANAWLLERKYPDEFGQRLSLKLEPEQIATLRKHGLTPMQAMEQLINALAEEAADGE